MRKILGIIICIILLIPIYSIELDCKAEIEGLLAEGKILILKIDGIPTMVEKLPGNLGSKTSCDIKIDEEGKWRVKSFLGMQSTSTNVLSVGDVLTVKYVHIGKKSIELGTRTEKAMPFDARGHTSLLGSSISKGTGIHANVFSFKINTRADCLKIKEQIGRFFDIYTSKEELNKAKEIKLGMTIEEVTKVLGEPQKKADLGEGKFLYKYDDTVVTFQDGKVVNIEFK